MENRCAMSDTKNCEAGVNTTLICLKKQSMMPASFKFQT